MQKYNPYDYQEYATSRILDTPCLGLFLDMGLGKTVSTLTALDILLNDSFEIEKILVIAPLRVAGHTWNAEIAKWAHLNHLTTSRILGTVTQRRHALRAEADIYIINRENICWLVDELGRKWDFDTVIIDELSSFKSASTKRFKALKRVRPYITRVVGLTGTPGSLMSLWSQVYILDQGERLGKTMSEFKDRYFHKGYMAYDYSPKHNANERIYEAIADIVVSMKAEDWLVMPERIDNYIKLQLPRKAWEQYQQLERTLLLPMLDTVITAQTAAVLYNKLLQMANGAVYDENKDVQAIHDVKLDALEELTENANGQPVLIFYAYRHDLTRLQAKFKDAVKLTSDEDIDRWNNSEIAILLAHPASVGHGINLQYGNGRTIIWFGLTWSSELYRQANARLYRQGQQQSVIIHHLVVTGTMDEDVIMSLADKITDEDELLEAVKARIEKVRRDER